MTTKAVKNTKWQVFANKTDMYHDVLGKRMKIHLKMHGGNDLACFVTFKISYIYFLFVSEVRGTIGK